MSKSTVSPFPRLPEDVLRLLIEAVGEKSQEAAVSVAQSCRQYQRWVYPMIYRSVNLRTVRSVESFLEALLHSDRNIRFLVKILTIDTLPGIIKWSRTSSSAMHIISLCTNVVSIALWSLKDSNEMVDLSKHVHLRRISIHMDYFMAGTICRPSCLPDNIPSFMFNLTHLDLYEFKERILHRAAILPHLHKLTHLFMVSASDEAFEIASHLAPLLPPSLKVWIIHFRYNHIRDMDVVNRLAGGEFDPRLVISVKTAWSCRDMPNAMYIINRGLEQTALTNTIWREWSYPLARGPDFWEEAEVVIERRKGAAKSVSRSPSPDESWMEVHW